MVFLFTFLMEIFRQQDVAIVNRAIVLESGDGTTQDATNFINASMNNQITTSKLLSNGWNLDSYIGRPIEISRYDLSTMNDSAISRDIRVSEVLDSHDLLQIIRRTFGYVSIQFKYHFEIQSTFQHVGTLGIFSIPCDNEDLEYTGYHSNEMIQAMPVEDLYKNIFALEIPLGTSTTHTIEFPWFSAFSAHIPYGFKRRRIPNRPGERQDHNMTVFDPVLCYIFNKWIVPFTTASTVPRNATLIVLSEITSIKYHAYATFGV
uniref:Uncharacterized protein n=1 Tax=Cacaos virus TaxID=2689365 RepID=A0A6B9KTW5_9VIRU|nr:hypothetical protein 4 [Cacaos virus]